MSGAGQEEAWVEGPDRMLVSERSSSEQAISKCSKLVMI